MEHDGDLGAGGVVLGGQGGPAVGADAGDDAVADRPLHRRDRVGADCALVGEAVQRGGAGRRGTGVAVQDGRDLLTGDLAVRVEGRGGRAVDDALAGRPEDRLIVVLVLLVVGELVGDTGNGGFARRTVQDRDEHGAGHVLAGAEDVGVLRADAVDKAVAVHEVDGVGRPLERAGDIGELARRRLLHDLEGQRALVAAVDGVVDLDGLAVGQREDIEVVDGVRAGEGESRRAEVLGCERGAAVDLAVLRVELAADDSGNGDVRAGGIGLGRELVRDRHGLKGRAGGVHRVRIVDVDDQIAVGLAVRAVSGERDDDGILRRAGASDERDVLQERRARGHVVALAADLAGARGAALIQRAARIARRAEPDGTQAGTIDRLEVADLHGLGLVRGDMVGNGTGVRHDDELAGRDLAAGAVGRVIDGVAARAARRLERHAADVAGRILVARRDGAGQGAGGIDRAGRRQREGEGAGRGARGLLDRVGELAAVEHDVARILLEHQLHILRRGDGDGDLLRAGVLVAVDGGLCRDRRGAAGLGGQRHGGAGAAVQRNHVAAFRYRPADGIGLAGHIGVGLSGRVILLRDRIQRDRIARLDAGRARRDLHIVIAADGDHRGAGVNGACAGVITRIAAGNHAVETIAARRGNEVGQIQCRGTGSNSSARS